MDPLTIDLADKSDDRLRVEFDDFQRLYANELETYLVSRVNAAASSWRRDYSSEEAYLDSVAANREAWRRVLGCVDEDAVNDLQPQTRPLHDGDDYQAFWVQFEFLPGVISRAVIARPARATGPAPVVICQHGIGSSPFHLFGRLDDGQVYAAYALALLEAGFAVIAPANRTTGPGRNRLERLAHLTGITLFGLECFKLEKLIDYVATLSGYDTTRLGMSGLSLGGAATLLFTPVIDRIKAACSMAWFNHRRKKMAVIDPRYSCFLATAEEHAFIPGWLPEFSDSDLVSLICPRPVQIQTGKADGISWWPFVQREWNDAKAHYERLGVPDRAEWVLHDSGHEVVPTKVVEFFQRWL